jgi:hypothetical protein
MRVEQLLQVIRGLRNAGQKLLIGHLERVKWFLWHGNLSRADSSLQDLIDEVDDGRNQDREAALPPSVVLKKLARALDEFAT